MDVTALSDKDHSAHTCQRCKHAGRPLSQWQSHRTAGSKLCFFFKGRKSSKRAKTADSSNDDKEDDVSGKTTTHVPIATLPLEVLERILTQVSDAETLLSLPTVCKLFAQIVNNDNQVFWQNWREANPSLADWLKYAAAHGAKRSVALAALKGCEICDAARVKLVYPFGVRCCTTCLYSRTICHRRLPVPLNKELFALPHTSVWRGNGEKRFYWIAQLHKYAQDRGCRNIEHLAQRILEEQEQTKKERAREAAARKAEREQAKIRGAARRANAAAKKAEKERRKAERAQDSG
ncbi:hypothetical protein HDU87_008356 [Geranomyces variabilis]|uniref:F-box domain-containing protein n=1 Tax=Geranomyces variabilis TaxID=109894 RepID=A0AAD5TDH9_9FUNG|nr:hypothetical protein HDU87_008356 [Geranomyces variabilis]